MRVLQTAAREVTALHQLLAGLMDRGGLVMDGPNQGIPVRHPSHEGEVLANRDARNIGLNGLEWATNVVRGCGFGIPGIQMAWAADKKKKDAVDLLGVAGGARLSKLHQVRNGQADRTRCQSAHPEEIAPGQAITEFNTFSTLELQHGGYP